MLRPRTTHIPQRLPEATWRAVQAGVFITLLGYMVWFWFRVNLDPAKGLGMLTTLVFLKMVRADIRKLRDATEIDDNYRTTVNLLILEVMALVISALSVGMPPRVH